MTAVDYKQSISWNGTGLFTSTGSNVIDRIRTAVGIGCSRGKDQIRQFSPPIAGTSAFELDNLDRELSPGNTSSALFGKVTSGKMTRLATEAIAAEDFLFADGDTFEFEDGTTMEFYDIPSVIIWSGNVDAFQHHPEWGSKSVGLTCLGRFARLRGKVIPPTAIYQSIRIDEAIDILLDLAGWPAADRDLDVSTVTLEWWWLDNQDAFDALVELVNTEGASAYVYESAAGEVVFKNNMALMTESRSTSVQQTFSDVANVIVEDYEDGSKSTILAASVVQQVRAAQALQQIWSYADTLTMAAGEVKMLEVRGSDIFINAATPSPVGVNAEQLLTPTATLTNGSFIAKVNGIDTSPIAYNDSTATIQGIFDTAVGAGNTILAGSLATGLRVQFTGDLAFKEIPLITITSSLNVGSKHATVFVINATETNSKYIIYPSSSLVSGTFRIKNHLGNKSLVLNYNATAHQIELAIIAQPVIGPGDVTVSGSNDVSTDQQTVEFDASLGTVLLSITDDSTLMTNTASTATITVTETVRGSGPDYLISAGDATFELDRDNGASVMLTVTAGASGATITGLQVRAQPVTVTRTNQVTYPVSTSLPDGQIFKPAIRSEISLAVAEDLVFDLYDRYHLSRPTESIVIYTPLYSENVFVQYALEIGDRVKVIGAQNGINDDFYVEQINHFLDSNSNLLRSTYGCEKAA